MKRCRSCGDDKPLNNFYSNGLYKGKMKYKPTCKKCEKAADVKRYYKIVENHFGRLACSTCGYDKCVAALDLHHLDPSTKDFDPSEMKNFSEERIRAELSKCVMLCANCHREVHHNL